MTPAELAAHLRALNLSQSEASRRLGIAHPTLWRYVHGHLPIPGPVAAAVRSWLELEQSKQGAAHA